MEAAEPQDRNMFGCLACFGGDNNNIDNNEIVNGRIEAKCVQNENELKQQKMITDTEQMLKICSEDSRRVFELCCGIQEYDWGKIGQDSMVAILKASADPTFRIDPMRKYAELWMGTHPNCPSVAIIPGKGEIPLLDWVRLNPDSLGQRVKDYFNGNLPYLFKVLSVRTALSIQAHPNKMHAELLHKEQPDLYKDPNHKPEMAIALTPFLGLCGFRPIKEVAEYLKNIEELRNAVGPNNAIKLMTASRSMTMPLHREAMKNCFSGLFENSREVVKAELSSLVRRVHDMTERHDDLSPVVGDIILKLHREFPGDPGAFCVYFLNVVHLQPGEAMFLEANLPHAYLSGDCMECMACSDNVVRAGLTPKYIDKHTLVEMLDYTSRTIAKTKFPGIMQPLRHRPPTEGEENKDWESDVDQPPEVMVTIFHPEVPDFGVTKYDVPPNIENFTFPALESASISIVIRGDGEATNHTLPEPLVLRQGTVFYTGAHQEVAVKVFVGSGMLVFRSYAGRS